MKYSHVEDIYDHMSKAPLPELVAIGNQAVTRARAIAEPRQAMAQEIVAEVMPIIVAELPPDYALFELGELKHLTPRRWRQEAQSFLAELPELDEQGLTAVEAIQQVGEARAYWITLLEAQQLLDDIPNGKLHDPGIREPLYSRLDDVANEDREVCGDSYILWKATPNEIAIALEDALLVGHRQGSERALDFVEREVAQTIDRIIATRPKLLGSTKATWRIIVSSIESEIRPSLEEEFEKADDALATTTERYNAVACRDIDLRAVQVFQDMYRVTGQAWAKVLAGSLGDKAEELLGKFEAREPADVRALFEAYVEQIASIANGSEIAAVEAISAVDNTIGLTPIGTGLAG